MKTANYPKRLIEVDLPIKRISEHARREKSIRHGHISTLHIWWARRPLAACRAVICAALWPDPADPLCPASFRGKARKSMLEWTTHERQALLSAESRQRFEAARQNPKKFDNDEELRKALLDFIADFSNWDNSTKKEYLDTSRTLTQSAHEALGGEPGTKPLVVDPFAGGGSIPLEALRVGADAFASDLNPVAVLLNKVVLEYIPKYGQRLADEVRKWGGWIRKEAEKELADFYPKDSDGATPIAYLWARTIRCEGPGCGAEVPLLRSLWLTKKTSHSAALQLMPRPRAKSVDFQIIVKQRGGWVDQNDPQESIADPKFDGTVKRGSATCPCCGYTTPVARVRAQLRANHGGIPSAQLMCVVITRPDEQGRFYRTRTRRDLEALEKASRQLEKRKPAGWNGMSLVPDEQVNPLPHSVNRLPLYGMNTWGDVFTDRQKLSLTTFGQKVAEAEKTIGKGSDPEFSVAIKTCLAIAVNRQADRSSSLVRWACNRAQITNTFGRQALPMVWDFAEAGILDQEAAGNFGVTVQTVVEALERLNVKSCSGTSQQASACCHPLPNDAAQALVTDPPYYDMISYADLSDFFYVWFRRVLNKAHPSLFARPASPKAEEIIVEPTPVEDVGVKDEVFYLDRMTLAMSESRRVVQPSGVGIVVFAHKSTSGWEAQLKAMIDAGWTVTGSWPIDTEMTTKVAGLGQARLASSIHLVCRPRENPDGSIHADEVGDWRDVLAELPRRIHEWMPRLSAEGIVGADAIFSCLGPALEIFSCYTRVEKASGEQVTLREYLEQVWAAVAKEALNMIFEGADATGFEEDARLTAMWLWTLSTGNNGNGKSKLSMEDDEIDEEDESEKTKKAMGGYALEYDAARKIAQGLGAYLEKLNSIVEVKGDTARLLPVSERTRYLFGKDEKDAPTAKRKKIEPQLKLGFIQEIEDVETREAWGAKSSPKAGSTVLDRLHQSMILFAAGRSEALKRFLVEEGAGNDQRFWGLAQALSALYPKSSDEKRWVDGVLARKKGLGF